MKNKQKSTEKDNLKIIEIVYTRRQKGQPLLDIAIKQLSHVL